jgi:hypothetical protein
MEGVVSSMNNEDEKEIECQDCGYMTNAYEAFIVGLDEYYCPDCCPEGYGE